MKLIFKKNNLGSQVYGETFNLKVYFVKHFFILEL